MDQAEWEFICLLPLFDPPRHDTKETIERCREKGIDVKMVTGDQLLIGKETSRQLGLGTDMYSTEALLEVSICPPCSGMSCQHVANLHPCGQLGLNCNIFPFRGTAGERALQHRTGVAGCCIICM